MNSHRLKDKCSIDAMEQLMNQVEEFEQALRQSGNIDDPALQQEYRLFNQYLKWRIEDINKDSLQIMQANK